MTWRLNTRLTQSSQWGWVELIWRLEPGNSTLTRWVAFGSGVQRPGNLPSTPPAPTNIFPGGEKSALTRIRVRQSQAGSDTGLTRAKGSQTKDEPFLKQGGGRGGWGSGTQVPETAEPRLPFRPQAERGQMRGPEFEPRNSLANPEQCYAFPKAPAATNSMETDTTLTFTDHSHREAGRPLEGLHPTQTPPNSYSLKHAQDGYLST